MANIRIALEEEMRFKLMVSAIALLTIIICYGLIRGGARGAEELRLKISEEAQRIALRADIDKIDTLSTQYYKYLYTPDKLALRDNISIMARQSGVDILSTQPMAIERIGDFTRAPLMLKLSSTYNQLGKLIAKIESLPNLIRIEEITVDKTARGGFEYNRGDRSSHGKEEDDILKDEKASISLLISAYSSER